jgi:DNA modification methylase
MKMDGWQVRSPEDNKFLSPYQKPAKLFAKLFSNHSRDGDWVLDVTGGSGYSANILKSSGFVLN